MTKLKNSNGEKTQKNQIVTTQTVKQKQKLLTILQL